MQPKEALSPTGNYVRRAAHASLEEELLEEYLARKTLLEATLVSLISTHHQLGGPVGAAVPTGFLVAGFWIANSDYYCSLGSHRQR